MPEACKRCLNEPCEDDYVCELMDEAVGRIVDHAVRGFVSLANNVIGTDAAVAIAGGLEHLEMINDGRPALDMLYGIFSAAGMKPLADEIYRLICIGREIPDFCRLFMCMFLDDEEIDWYLVESWFTNEFKEARNGEMQDNCDM